jgi:hypothetical protein
MTSKFSIFLAFIFFGLIKAIPGYDQQSGCTDPLATNYNSEATVNNGSCVYNTTNYSPSVVVSRISKVLNEISGLQMAESSLWSINDGGGQAAIYRIDTSSNALLQTVILENAANVDWEEISFDGKYFYIGDFGNNGNGARKDLKIYKFPIYEIPNYTSKSVVTIPKEKIEIISFKFSNQGDPIVTNLNNTKYDCEAMIIDKGKIHLFSKNWVNANTTHYVINSTRAGNYIADSLETLSTNYLVTAAAKAPGHDIIVLIGYVGKAPGKHYMHILSDYSDGRYFNGNKRRLNLPDALQMGQAEGITFKNDTSGYISNERLGAGPFVIHQKLRSFDISNLVTVPAKRSIQQDER